MSTPTPGALLILSDDFGKRRPDPAYGLFVGADFRSSEKVFVTFGPGLHELVDLTHLTFFPAGDAAPAPCFGLGACEGFQVPESVAASSGVVVWREAYDCSWKIGRFVEVKAQYANERPVHGHDWKAKPTMGPSTLRCSRCFAEIPFSHSPRYRDRIRPNPLQERTLPHCQLCNGLL